MLSRRRLFLSIPAMLLVASAGGAQDHSTTEQ